MPDAIHIRRYAAKDVDSIFEAIMESKAELTPWANWCHDEYCKQETAAWVKGRPSAWRRGEEWSFAIVDSDDRFLGGCGIHRIDAKNGVAELGYWVRTTAARRGVATEATRQLCRWGFCEQNLARIEMVVSVENVASGRVAEKAGGVREGILQQRIVLHGRRHDCFLFSILRTV